MISGVISFFKALVDTIWTLLVRFYNAIFSFHSKSITFDGGMTVSISDTIGEGAYSFVYKAKSGRESYALKVMYLQTSDLERSAKTEIASLQKFRHPCIVPLLKHSIQHDATKGNIAYLLFPLITRGSLRDVLTLQISQPPSRHAFMRALHDFRSICEAVNVLHEYKPSHIHQDIKPENILMSEDGRPLLTDFGSVRPADVFISDRSVALRVADEASRCCTISYRAPELFEPPTGCHLDARTDVWSLGCLLFAWWHGYSPYECELLEFGVRVVECTHLRVLSKISTRANPSREDVVIHQLADAILDHDMENRMFTTDVISKVEEAIRVAQQEGNAV